ncbi:MAG: gfo/Idh/MocA family oxidoreductase, partial [Tannerella sp.]|nr:gfo/Idh/MocA family oxidoreductase [Tannerella sp.]
TFTNIGADEKITTILKDDFKVVDGHPTFNKPSLPPVSAQEFAAELINHKYRDGWKLPAMP